MPTDNDQMWPNSRGFAAGPKKIAGAICVGGFAIIECQTIPTVEPLRSSFGPTLLNLFEASLDLADGLLLFGRLFHGSLDFDHSGEPIAAFP